MKLLFSIFLGFFCLAGNTVFAEDEFDSENFDTTDDVTITNGDDATNLECQGISLEFNDDANPVAVNNFDIAGIMLGMNFEDVMTIARDNGLYRPIKKNSVVYSIHQDWKYNLDYECRQNNIFAPAALERCINSLAKNRGVLYASELHLERTTTGETIDVFFTSNATDNVVWKIVYKNDVDELEGDDEKFANQRDKKVMAFWQNVLDKYGSPNAGDDKWASSDNSYDPVMTAYFGELELIDCGNKNEDGAINIQQANDNFIAKPYAF